MNHLSLLLQLKLTLLKNHYRRLKTRSRLEYSLLIVFFLAAGIGLFVFFHYAFRFFRSQEPFGPILLDETLYLFSFALFVMLFISTGVSAYAALFKSNEVPFLVTRGIQWEEIYFLKLAESIGYSSWALLLVVIPFMAAYGINKEVGVIFYPLLCFAFYLPFVILAGTLGTLSAILTMWLLPGRRHRQTALLLVVAFVVFFFAKTAPQVIKEQGSIAGILSGYLPHVSFAKNAFFPSCWLTRGILGLSNISLRGDLPWEEGTFYFLLLVSNVLFFLIPSYSAGARLYPAIYLRAQDYGEVQTVRRVKIHRWLEQIIDRLPYPPRPVWAFLEKDLKSFARDPSEWSQLLIFFGLLLFYFANLKNLEFHVLKSFWKNLVFVLNTIGTYIVLSSFSMRFIFPMISLESSRFWIIDLSPIRFSQLLLEKFLLGTILSMILTLPLVFLSGWMLDIPLSRVLFATGLGFFVCIALTGLSVGLGATFPNFKSTNPSEIISGFGGSLLLASHLAYLVIIGLFLMLAKEPHWLVFLTVAAGSLLVGMLPLKFGLNALKQMEF